MKEKALRIGEPTPLVAVVTQPDTLDKDKPAILLLNSGVMHHIGACRLSVKLARNLAQAGFLSLRFDYSGIGDSEPRRGALSFEESAPKETKEVMDYLERKVGIKKFILYGLCSGSDAAYETALVDERVCGIAQIDAYCYKNWKYHVNHYAPRLFKWSHWSSFAKRKLGLMKTTKELAPHEAAGVDEAFFEVPSYTRIFPPQTSVAAGLQALMDRNVRILTIFTGSEPDYNYKNQFFDTFKGVINRDLYDLEYYDEASHIISEPKYQEIVVERIRQWVKEL